MKTYNLFLLILILLLSNCSSNYKEQADRSASGTASEAIKADEADKVQPGVAKDIDLKTNVPKDKKFIKTAEVKFKVGNVLQATEKIEDLTAKYAGYIIMSNLQNRVDNTSSSRISRDSVMICKEIVVVNDIVLKVPNENLDSLVRELNKLIEFLEYRVVRLDDVTFRSLANQKKTERLQNYDRRQTQHIDNKESRLKETTNAEDALLNRQLQSDDLKIQSQELEDQIKYCTLTLSIYQKPIIVRETKEDFDYVTKNKPGFFSRILDSIIQGWSILEEIVVFLFNIWGIILLIVGAILLYKFVFKRKKAQVK